MSTDLAMPLLSAPATGRLLAALFRHGPMTRSQATSIAGLARSAAGKAAEDLEKLGVLETAYPIPPGTRGRPSAILALRAAAGVVVGSLGRDGIRIAVIDVLHTFRYRSELRIKVADESPSTALKMLGEVISETIRKSPVLIVGVGLSVPGIYNQQTGIAQALLPIGWRDIEMARTLARFLPPGLPVQIAHDATLAALAEFRWGSGKGSGRLLFLSGETVGLGSALIVADENGGHSDHSLQAGHLIVEPGGLECSCGARGCLELYADGRALARSMGDRPDSSIDELMRWVEETDENGAFEEILSHLQTGLVSLVNTLAPDRVVLSGLLSGLATRFHAELSRAIGTSVVAQLDPVELASSTLKDDLLIGAAELAFEPFIRNPEAVFAVCSASQSLPFAGPRAQEQTEAVPRGASRQDPEVSGRA